MRSLIIIILFLTTLTCMAQSTLFLKNGEKYNNVKIRNKNRIEIICISTNGTIQKIKKSDVFVYKPRERRSFTYTRTGKKYKIKNIATSKVDASSVCQQGTVAAYNNFDPSGPMVGTAFPTALAMPVGLITAIGVSTSRPMEKNLKIPSQHKNNEEYVSCYKDAAFKYKKSATWRSFWSGWAIGISLVLFVGTVSTF